jgi:trehalose/maltose hydrolase-like predicted phosphorylase
MSTWTLAYESFEPEEESLREALTSTGNGYFCTRGASEWAEAGDIHYPGTYMHGGFNRATTIMAGRPIVNEDLVNMPNWLVLKLRIEGEEPIALNNVDLLSYHHEYDIRNALLSRTIRFRDRQERETTLVSRRFVCMATPHDAAIEWTITAENWSGHVEILSGLDGRVTNSGVARYRQLESRHLVPVRTQTVAPDIISLVVHTRQSHIYVAEAARTRVYGENEPLAVDRFTQEFDGYIHQAVSFHVTEKQPVRVEKIVAFYSSRDNAISEPMVNAQQAVARAPTFEVALERHKGAWDDLWAVSDIVIPKDENVQRLIRFHISQVLQVCSPVTADLDAGVPARGLNGEAYRGHIFWDELYIYPFLNFRFPDITRELLMYRYRRLGMARALAKAEGHKGAMFPWQSGSDGTEETQVVHLNPKSGKWDPDFSHNQRHVNAAIFYNIWQYYMTTNDIDFMWDFGAEMLLCIARFWSSITHFNEDRQRYEIHGIMGPDEFHEALHGSDDHGVPNNAYTNLMVAWISEIALEVMDLVPQRRMQALRRKVGLKDEDIAKWKDMSGKMFAPFHDDGILSQFEGYEGLEEMDWEGYRAKYGNIQRLDRILKAEGDTPDRFKLAKQADTLMLWFLFDEEVLAELFKRLGYEYRADTRKRNIDYYERRTSHGSTLSYIVHADVESGVDPKLSWDRFKVALESDVNDIQGGTTKEGIHMGVMAGTLDLIQRGFLGTEIHGDFVSFDPKPIDELDGLSLTMLFRRTPFQVTRNGDELTVSVQLGGRADRLRVRVGGEEKELSAGESYTFRF